MLIYSYFCREYKRYFYCHEVTGDSQWEFPQEDEEQEIAALVLDPRGPPPPPPEDQQTSGLSSEDPRLSETRSFVTEDHEHGKERDNNDLVTGQMGGGTIEQSGADSVSIVQKDSVVMDVDGEPLVEDSERKTVENTDKLSNIKSKPSSASLVMDYSDDSEEDSDLIDRIVKDATNNQTQSKLDSGSPDSLSPGPVDQMSEVQMPAVTSVPSGLEFSVESTPPPPSDPSPVAEAPTVNQVPPTLAQTNPPAAQAPPTVTQAPPTMVQAPPPPPPEVNRTTAGSLHTQQGLLQALSAAPPPPPPPPDAEPPAQQKKKVVSVHVHPCVHTNL